MSVPPEQPPAPTRQRSLLARILRFPLKLILYVILGLGFSARRHPRISTLLIALLLIASGVLYYFSPILFPSSSAPTTTTTSPSLTSVQGSLPSPQTPLLYFQAQQAGNAAAMWNLLSDSVKQGGSIQALQAQLNQMKPRLGTIEKISYVGGAREQNGDAVYLYLLTINQGGKTEQVTYLFTLNPQGKILKLE